MLPGKTYTADEVVNIVWAKKWLILVPFVVISAGTAVVAHFLPNKYRADTLMLVVPQQIPEIFWRSTITTKIEDRLNSISQQIMSRTRLERIILDNNLYVKERQTEIMQDIVEQMRLDIDIDVIKGDAFRISYVGNDPRTVTTVTDRLASLFIEENVNERAQLAEGTNQFLQTQLDNARVRLAGQEAKLEEYKNRYSGQLPSQADANMQVIQNTQLQIQSLLQSLNRDRDRKLVVQSMLADLMLPDNQSVQMPELGGQGQVVVMSARQQLTIALARLRQLEGQLTPVHPDIVAARRQITELEKRAEAEDVASPMSPDAGPAMTPSQAARRSRIKALQLELESLERQIASQQAQERQLRATVATYQARLEMVPARETELVELTRDYTTLKEIYADLLQKNEESKGAVILERRQIGEQFKLLDPARMPEKPVSPNRPLINLAGLGIGLLVGLGLVAFQEYRDTSFKTEDDVVRLLGLPVLGRIPLMVEFIRLLPEGVGCIPMYAGIREHSERGYLSALENYNAKVAELAEIGVDLIHPEGGPPFMVRGYKAEQEIVGGWESKYKIPIFTSGMTQTEALRALGIKKFVGCTYFRDQKMNDIFTRYFTDSGFEVLGMEGMDTSPGEADGISTETIYQHLKSSFNKHPTAQGIYLLGSGAWQVKDIVAVENDLGVPVVHPVAARVWYVQKMLRVRNPIKGASRLLDEIP